MAKTLPLSGHRHFLGTWGLATGLLGRVTGPHAQLNVLLLNKRPAFSFCARPTGASLAPTPTPQLGSSIFLPMSYPLGKPYWGGKQEGGGLRGSAPHFPRAPSSQRLHAGRRWALLEPET